MGHQYHPLRYMQRVLHAYPLLAGMKLEEYRQYEQHIDGLPFSQYTFGNVYQLPCSFATSSFNRLNDVLLQFFRLFLVQQRNSPITIIRESIPNSFQLSGDTCSASTSNAASTSHRKAFPAVFLVIQKVLHYLLSG